MAMVICLASCWRKQISLVITQRGKIPRMEFNLEKDLIVPVRVDDGQLPGNSVVFASPQGVHTREDQLFVHSNLTYIRQSSRNV